MEYLDIVSCAIRLIPNRQVYWRKNNAKRLIPNRHVYCRKNNVQWFFLKRGILVPENARCCSLHMYKCQLNYEALEMIEPSKLDELILNSDDIKSLMSDFRLTINSTKSFDFDNPGSLDDESYKTITGLSRG